ncbi:hypothetical protein [Micromonospora sp. NPDC049497]|uniref:hypothetical protein n=1 Tax=Micromonospora sp. NPDC049497 TaxID=3364273 RepID=UPI0037A837D2
MTITLLALVNSAGHECGPRSGRGSGRPSGSKELGWHVRWDATGQRWERCTPDVEGSGPYLNRLYRQAWRGAGQRRWLRRPALLFARRMRGDQDLF